MAQHKTGNSSADVVELLQSCTKPLISDSFDNVTVYMPLTFLGSPIDDEWASVCVSYRQPNCTLMIID